MCEVLGKMGCDCLKKKSILTCSCELDTIGYISAWFGIVSRIIVIGLLSSTISRMTESDPSMLMIILGSTLAYASLSFIVNSLFIYGIYARHLEFLFPYITIVALEMIVSVIVCFTVVMFLFAVGYIALPIWILLITMFAVGVHFILWVCNVLHFKDLEYQARIGTTKGNRIIMTRVCEIDR